MLVDHIAPIPPVMVSALGVVPRLPEGIKFFVQEIVVVEVNRLVHSAFLQVLSESQSLAYPPYP